LPGARINPGITAGSPLQWELNGLSVGVLYDNTFVYTPKGAVPAFGFKSILQGIVKNEHFATRYIPGSTAQNAWAYLEEGDLRNRSLSDNSTRLNGMGWLQYGLNYSAILFDDGNNQWKAGISLNYLQGIVAAYVKNTHLNYTLGDTTQIACVQGDYRLSPNYYINATIVKGLGHGDRQGVVQPDLYSITPRYESRWWDLSIPLSLLYYGQWRARVGLAVRAGYVFFGGDAPAGLLSLSNMQGVDVYAGVRFFVFRK
jgi:hypothetical protein